MSLGNAGPKRLSEESIGQPEVKPNSGKVAQTADHSISSLEKVMD